MTKVSPETLVVGSESRTRSRGKANMPPLKKASGVDLRLEARYITSRPAAKILEHDLAVTDKGRFWHSADANLFLERQRRRWRSGRRIWIGRTDRTGAMESAAN